MHRIKRNVVVFKNYLGYLCVDQLNIVLSRNALMHVNINTARFASLEGVSVHVAPTLRPNWLQRPRPSMNGS